MSYTSQNFRLFLVSNLSVLNFRIFLLMTAVSSASGQRPSGRLNTSNAGGGGGACCSRPTRTRPAGHQQMTGPVTSLDCSPETAGGTRTRGGSAGCRQAESGPVRSLEAVTGPGRV